MDKKRKWVGTVFLVGAGPGDPQLITIKGLNKIKKADVIIYDRLVPDRLLHYASEKAEFIYVGKLPDRHTMIQGEINALLAEKAEQGLTVVRLKGGDPFVFGRGGEEAIYLAERKIPFEIVPGITSAVAVPTYAGIPVTHRGLASCVTIATGHEEPAKSVSDLDWPALARNPGTNVILMGMANLPLIVERLTAEGMPSSTPVALINRGTKAGQQTITGTLSNIEEKTQEAGLKNPLIIVTGKVVEMRKKIKWFEQKPLFGKRIIITRAREQTGPLTEKLEELGADIFEIPMIKIVPPLDFGPFDRTIAQLENYRWVIFTSKNGVESFFTRLREINSDIRKLKNAKICAIGPATKEALEIRGLRVDIMPSEYRAEALLTQLKSEIINGDRVLLPRSDIARVILPETLKEMGAFVDEVVAYRTVPGETEKALLMNILTEEKIDMIIFTSSSTIRNFVALLDKNKDFQILENVRLVSIGPVTSKTALELGLSIDLEAEKYSVEGLVDLLLADSTQDKERENK